MDVINIWKKLHKETLSNNIHINASDTFPEHQLHSLQEQYLKSHVHVNYNIYISDNQIGSYWVKYSLPFNLFSHCSYLQQV